MINYGSQIVLQIVEIEKNIDDYTMSLPLAILSKLNADFDGDILNIQSLKIANIAQEFYEALCPRLNMFISRNDGKFDMDACLFKDQIIGLYAFANID